MKSKKTGTATTMDYDAANLRNARAFLEHPEAYGGPDAFPCVWARAVLQRLELGR